MKNYKSIDINEIDDLIGKINLIDVREPHEFKSASIQTAENIPMGELLEFPENYLDKDEEYYIMCRAGHRSLSVCRELLDQGYKVYDVTSGMDFYEGNKRN